MLVSAVIKASFRLQSYQFKVSEVGSYQCILSLEGLGGPCLFISVLGSTCKSTDAVCNRFKSLVGSDWEAKKMFYIWNYQTIYKVKWRWGPNVWNTVCWTYDHPTTKLTVFVNNQTVEFPFIASIYYFPQAKMEIFFLNSKERNHSFPGAVTDIHLWSRVLSESEVRAWADCGSESGGDLLDWSSAQLNITGLSQFPAERDEICGRKSRKKIIAAFNRRLDFYHSVKFCTNFGQIASAREETERELMLSSLDSIEGHTCNKDLISAGLMWSQPAQAWSEVSTGGLMTVENWYQGRPSNDTTADDCLFILTHDQTFYDTSCLFSELCPVCRITKVGKVWL